MGTSTQVLSHCRRQETAQLHRPKGTLCEQPASARFAEQPLQRASVLTLAEVLHRALDTSSLLSMLTLPVSTTRSLTSCVHMCHVSTATNTRSSFTPAMALQQLQVSVSTSHQQGCCCKAFLASGHKPSHHRCSRRGSCCSHRGRPQRCARCLASQREDITERHGPLQGTSVLLYFPHVYPIHAYMLWPMIQGIFLRNFGGSLEGIAHIILISLF